MRLEDLCEFRMSYDEHGFVVVQPFGGQEGQGYGTGTGEVTGDRLSGPMRWSNYPRLTDDGVALPDVRGVISTAAGPVLFEIHGSSIAGETQRDIAASVVFRTQAEEHKWLNHALVVQEGKVDFTAGAIVVSTYVCLPG